MANNNGTRRVGVIDWKAVIRKARPQPFVGNNPRAGFFRTVGPVVKPAPFPAGMTPVKGRVRW